MKKQYVAIVAIIIIMMAVLLGVYKVGSSVGFGKKGNVLSDSKEFLIEYINGLENEAYKDEQFNYFSNKYNWIE